MRLLFAGTPEAALPSLRTLLDSHHEVVGVLTQPDARTGRGRKLRPSPVKTLALEAGIPVLTPATLRDDAVRPQLRDLARGAATAGSTCTSPCCRPGGAPHRPSAPCSPGSVGPA